MSGRWLTSCGVLILAIFWISCLHTLALEPRGVNETTTSYGSRRVLLKSKKKHGHHGHHSSKGGGGSLDKYRYRDGEFALKRHAQEKLYPRTGAFFPGRGNLAIMKRVLQSSYKPGFVPLAAVDGDQFGFYEEHHSYAATKLERNPWIHITLFEEPVSVSSVEVWFPARKCDQYLKDLSPSEKNKWMQAVKKNSVPKLPWWCQYTRKNIFYQPSRAAPLEIILKDGEHEMARRTYTEPMSVVTWDVEANATSVLARVLGSAQLSVAEFKVFGKAGTTRCGKATCLHGRCKKTGHCECQNDWVGQDCSVNIRGDTKYLPNESDGSWWDESATLSFNSTAEKLEGREYCDQSVAPHLLPGPAGLGAGLGSTMFFRAGDLTRGLKEGRGYNYVGMFNYARNDYCKAQGLFGDFSCYFVENPNCRSFVEKKRATIKFPALTQKNAKGQDCLLPHQECKMRETFNEVPSPWAKKDIYWWRSHQIARLFRLNKETTSLLDLEGLKERIKFQNPMIGVHMRSGDGCRHGVRSRLFKCRTLSDYLPEVNALSVKYGTKTVFVATDNDKILEEIEGIGPESDLNFIVVPSDFREKLRSETKIEQRMSGVGGTFDSHSALVSALQDIFLLSECDYLVTHQASTMSRVALHLATMRKRAIPPFISLDGPWCPLWRMCCEPRHDTGQCIVC